MEQQRTVSFNGGMFSSGKRGGEVGRAKHGLFCGLGNLHFRSAIVAYSLTNDD